MSSAISSARKWAPEDDSDSESRPAATPRRILAVASHRGKGTIPWRNGRDEGEVQQGGGKPHWRKVQKAALRRFDADPAQDELGERDGLNGSLGWRRRLADALHHDGFVCGWFDLDPVDRFGYEPQDLPQDLAAEFYQGRHVGTSLQGVQMPEDVRACLRAIVGPR